jgi:chitinase
VLDLLNIMTYDFSGPWTPLSGHHAALYSPNPNIPSAHAAIDYLLAAGVPPAKLLLGIPVYGRSFLGVDAPGQHHRGHGGEEGTYEFRELPRPGAVECVDEALGAAWCVGPHDGVGGGWTSYDVPATVRVKAVYAKSRGLGGLFYWTGTGDRVGEGSLVLAGYKELHCVE